MNEKFFDLQRFEEVVSLTSGDDNYKNYASGAELIIYALEGNDTIKNEEDCSTVFGGDGNDSVYNNIASGVFIDGGEGDDTLTNEGTSAIDYETDETFYRGADVSLIGGSGKDYIQILGDGHENFVNGGKDDDEISLSYLSNVLIQYASGDGNDIIYGLDADDTLQITEGNYTYRKSGDDMILKIDDGEITIKGGSNTPIKIINKNGTVEYLSNFNIISNSNIDTLITGTSNGDSIYNSAVNVTVNAAAGNDTITNTGNNSVLNGGAGNDSIHNTADNVTVNAAEGNDTITNTGNNSVLNGDDDNDIITDTKSDNSLFDGGNGDDNISVGSAKIIEREIGDDECEAASRSYEQYGNYHTIFGGNGNDSIHVEANYSYINGDAGDDYISSGGKYIMEGGPALEYFVKDYGYGNIISGGEGNDTIENDGNNVGIDGGAGDDYIVDSPSDVGYQTHIEDDDEESLFVEGLPVGGYTNISGGEGKDTIFSYGRYVEVDGGSGDDCIYAALLNNITGGKGNDTIRLGIMADDAPPVKESNNFISYSVGDGNDIIYGFTQNDTLQIAGSYTTTKSGNDVIVKVGSGLITLSGAANIALNIATVEADKSSLLTYNAKKTAVTLAADYKGTLKSSDYDSTVKIVNASKVSSGIVINGNAQDNKILGGSGKDTIYGGKGNDSLNGGAGSDYLSGGKGSDTLTGGAGKDIFAYASGGGKDVITDYTAGTDKIKITSGTVKGSSLKGSDVVLKIGSGTLTVKKGKGQKITVVDSKGKSSTKIYDNKMAYNAKKTAVTLDSAFSGTLKSSSYSSTTKTIDASDVSKNIVINGNAKNNTITGGSGKDTIYGGKGNDSILGGAGKDKIYGDSGNDTLNGGKGSDTLTGGAGKDVFVYASGGGNDVITDYTAGVDKIKITSGKISKTSYSGKDVIFTIGSGTLKIKNGKGKKITINNSTKTYSGSKSSNVSALWFAEENNFAAADNLSSIVENDSAVSLNQITAQNFENLTSENNLITYADK